jgi:hypothetical protein
MHCIRMSVGVVVLSWVRVRVCECARACVRAYVLYIRVCVGVRVSYILSVGELL